MSALAISFEDNISEISHDELVYDSVLLTRHKDKPHIHTLICGVCELYKYGGDTVVPELLVTVL